MNRLDLTNWQVHLTIAMPCNCIVTKISGDNTFYLMKWSFQTGLAWRRIPGFPISLHHLSNDWACGIVIANAEGSDPKPNKRTESKSSESERRDGASKLAAVNRDKSLKCTTRLARAYEDF